MITKNKFILISLIVLLTCCTQRQKVQDKSETKNTDNLTNSYSSLVQNTIIPHLEYYFDKIHEERDSLQIDGVYAFTENDRFVGGKTINFMSYLVCNASKDDEDFEERIQKLSETIDFVSQYDHYETWSHMYALTGLHRLQEKNLLEKVVSPKTLEILKNKLDWRTFVDSTDLHLINKPTNYYNVAFSIAKYRELLGWETKIYSKPILKKLITHIKNHSGENPFMDETAGEGRFDRYSMLISAEICARLWKTNEPIPDFLLEMLRNSCDIALNIANEKGMGFSYGRSLGPYGDSAPLMILSIGACLNVLNDAEKELAYAYATKIVQRYKNFWLDSQLKSVNIWEKGRRTDEYRNKNRILGENISTCIIILNSFKEWQCAGYDYEPDFDKFADDLKNIPQFKYYTFTNEEYKRGLAIVRQSGHVFMLPLISGGKGYYNKTPYLPVPTELLFLETTPDTEYNHLVPKIVMNDGSELMPINYFKNIKYNVVQDTLTISCFTDELCLIGEKNPQKDTRFSCTTTYTFTQNTIEREDVFTCDNELSVKEVNLEFLTFSQNPSVAGNKIVFNEGSIKEIEVLGIGQGKVESLANNTSYFTPNGALKNKLVWKSNHIVTSNGFKVNWKINY